VELTKPDSPFQGSICKLTAANGVDFTRAMTSSLQLNITAVAETKCRENNKQTMAESIVR